MTWRLGWYPLNDPVSRAQERTEEMLEREDCELARHFDEQPPTRDRTWDDLGRVPGDDGVEPVEYRPV